MPVKVENWTGKVLKGELNGGNYGDDGDYGDLVTEEGSVIEKGVLLWTRTLQSYRSRSSQMYLILFYWKLFIPLSSMRSYQL